MIVLVGAGITGLSLSFFLDAAGVEHRVLEAAPRAGGVIRSSEVDGRILDHGPQRTRVTPPVAKLLRALDLEGRTVAVGADLPLYVVRGMRLRAVPFTPGALLRTDLLSTPGKARLLLEPFTAPLSPEETVGGFLTRKFGKEAYEGAMGPLFGGLYGSDPGEMFARHALREFLGDQVGQGSLFVRFLKGALRRTTTAPAVSFRQGMQELTDALARKQAHRLVLDAPVRTLTRAEGEGWVLAEEGGRSWHAAQVVFTTPPSPTAELLHGVAPEASARIRALTENRVAIVHLLGAPGVLHGLGYQVAYGEPIRSRGVTWSDSAFPVGRDGVYTAFLGGARDRAMMDESDTVIGDTASREFKAVTGVETRVLSITRTRVPAWDRSWTALDGLSLPAGLHLCTNWESRIGIPGRIARTQVLAQSLPHSLASSPAP